MARQVPFLISVLNSIFVAFVLPVPVDTQGKSTSFCFAIVVFKAWWSLLYPVYSFTEFIHLFIYNLLKILILQTREVIQIF